MRRFSPSSTMATRNERGARWMATNGWRLEVTPLDPTAANCRRRRARPSIVDAEILATIIDSVCSRLPGGRRQRCGNAISGDGTQVLPAAPTWVDRAIDAPDCMLAHSGNRAELSRQHQSAARRARRHRPGCESSAPCSGIRLATVRLPMNRTKPLTSRISARDALLASPACTSGRGGCATPWQAPREISRERAFALP